jgi:hypothetical protein
VRAATGASEVPIPSPKSDSSASAVRWAALVSRAMVPIRLRYPESFPMHIILSTSLKVSVFLRAAAGMTIFFVSQLTACPFPNF